MPQADRRTDDEIRADLIRHRSDGPRLTAGPLVRLLDDVEPLLAEVAALRAEKDRLRMSRHIPQIVERTDGAWGVICAGCSAEVGDYIHECKLGGAMPQGPMIARAELAAERARAAELTVALAAVEALLPGTAEEFAIFPYQIRDALGTTTADGVFIPRAALAAAASPSPSPVAGQEAGT